VGHGDLSPDGHTVALWSHRLVQIDSHAGRSAGSLLIGLVQTSPGRFVPMTTRVWVDLVDVIEGQTVQTHGYDLFERFLLGHRCPSRELVLHALP
jgi:hypothetical protein